jgi:tRNA (cmo5U34)-methyltransferase
MSASDTAALFDEKAASGYDTHFARLDAFKDALLLATQIALSGLPEDANILCVGAGTGREIRHLANAHPGWRFLAVEPSAAMMRRCQSTLGEAGLTGRCIFHEGYLDCAAGEGFDGATMLLVSQFLLDPKERQALFTETARRLRAGGLLVSADLSRPEGLQGESLFEYWIQTLVHNGQSPAECAEYRENIGQSVSMMAPDILGKLITEAGFEPPLRIFQTGLIHAWLTSRSEAMIPSQLDSTTTRA